MWDILLVILSLLGVIVGLLGAVLPALPGPPLSFLGVLLLWFHNDYEIGTTTLLIFAAFAILVTILDYVMPIWFTKKTGGTKAGMWGAGIGMFLGLFFSPWGLLLGPFLGALIGELYAGTHTNRALSVSFMTFVAFMLTTGIKVLYSLAALLFVVGTLFAYLF